MKRYYLLTLTMAFTFILNTAFAQIPGDKEKGERIEALKISFITDKLKLSSEEAKVFWPIYNAFEEEKKSLMKALKPSPGVNNLSLEGLTKETANVLINNEMTFQQKKLDLTKQYIIKFKTALSDEKVAVLLTLENQFKKILIEKMKQNEND